MPPLLQFGDAAERIDQLLLDALAQARSAALAPADDEGGGGATTCEGSRNGFVACARSGKRGGGGVEPLEPGLGCVEAASELHARLRHLVPRIKLVQRLVWPEKYAKRRSSSISSRSSLSSFPKAPSINYHASSSSAATGSKKAGANGGNVIGPSAITPLQRTPSLDRRDHVGSSLDTARTRKSKRDNAIELV